MKAICITLVVVLFLSTITLGILAYNTNEDLITMQGISTDRLNTINKLNTALSMKTAELTICDSEKIVYQDSLAYMSTNYNLLVGELSRLKSQLSARQDSDTLVWRPIILNQRNTKINSGGVYPVIILRKSGS